ncbi:hypothetical protein CTA1_3017 [Colletotrichum tanaceti]|uniref:Uncharacterized protein n=1 Tax=Colletotrichum tanaceti TaxID=1306861 RepID=A0A4U6XQB5_9PEZI|nr:hypothetical protein CTA1_3017 [Colletotrichum tanaceti]
MLETALTLIIEPGPDFGLGDKGEKRAAGMEYLAGDGRADPSLGVVDELRADNIVPRVITTSRLVQPEYGNRRETGPAIVGEGEEAFVRADGDRVGVPVPYQQRGPRLGVRRQGIRLQRAQAQRPERLVVRQEVQGQGTGTDRGRGRGRGRVVGVVCGGGIGINIIPTELDVVHVSQDREGLAGRADGHGKRRLKVLLLLDPFPLRHVLTERLPEQGDHVRRPETEPDAPQRPPRRGRKDLVPGHPPVGVPFHVHIGRRGIDARGEPGEAPRRPYAQNPDQTAVGGCFRYRAEAGGGGLRLEVVVRRWFWLEKRDGESRIGIAQRRKDPTGRECQHVIPQQRRGPQQLLMPLALDGLQLGNESKQGAGNLSQLWATIHHHVTLPAAAQRLCRVSQRAQKRAAVGLDPVQSLDPGPYPQRVPEEPGQVSERVIVQNGRRRRRRRRPLRQPQVHDLLEMGGPVLDAVCGEGGVALERKAKDAAPCPGGSRRDLGWRIRSDLPETSPQDLLVRRLLGGNQRPVVVLLSLLDLGKEGPYGEVDELELDGGLIAVPTLVDLVGFQKTAADGDDRGHEEGVCKLSVIRIGAHKGPQLVQVNARFGECRAGQPDQHPPREIRLRAPGGGDEVEDAAVHGVEPLGEDHVGHGVDPRLGRQGRRAEEVDHELRPQEHAVGAADETPDQRLGVVHRDQPLVAHGLQLVAEIELDARRGGGPVERDRPGARHHALQTPDVHPAEADDGDGARADQRLQPGGDPLAVGRFVEAVEDDAEMPKVLGADPDQARELGGRRGRLAGRTGAVPREQELVHQIQVLEVPVQSLCQDGAVGRFHRRVPRGVVTEEEVPNLGRVGRAGALDGLAEKLFGDAGGQYRFAPARVAFHYQDKR